MFQYEIGAQFFQLDFNILTFRSAQIHESQTLANYLKIHQRGQIT